MSPGKVTLNFLFLCCCQILFASVPITDGLVMHLDANSITDVADGAVISSWYDLSGLGNDATQTTAGIQPTYIAGSSVFNEMPVIHFDGTDDWMAMPSTTVSVGSFTAFLVAKYDHTSSNQYITAGQDGSGDDRLRFAVDTSGPVFEYRAGSTGWKSVTAPSDLDVHIFTMTSVVEGFLDGISIGMASNTSSEYPTAFNLGSYNRGQKDFFAGDVAELIIYNRVLTDAEQNEVGVYLETKYGLDTAYAAVDPQVHTPDPSNGSQNVALDAVLSWQGPAEVNDPVYNVYFDIAETFPTLVSEGQTENTFDPYGASLMQPEQMYNWRVDIEGISEGPLWSFATRPEPVASLAEDLNEDGIVDIQDLFLLAQRWLDATDEPVDIDQSGKVDNGDVSCFSSSWGKEGPLPGSYVVSRYHEGDFKVAFDGVISSIYVDSSDHTVCQTAAECLSDDIERVCGIKPTIVHDTAGLSGHVIFIGTVGHSIGIDAFVAGGTIDVSDMTGQWETFALEVVDNPVVGVDRGLVIAGSDRRGTAFGVFDLSEKMGVSPWFWWADVPVRYRENIVVRDGRYKDGPPSVKYRGIFINDEDWGLHPWARNTYAPEDGYIGPKTYQKVFELLLRLKANHIWPAMHDCTKAFNAFEENKVIADQYAIVMGSSHCEQMLRNNVWEWYRWTPSGGGDRGSWDWCTNSANITEYWEDRVETNAAYENVYTTGMRGIHDGSMPCSGATNAEKVQKMEDEIFPAQRQMIIDWINPDPTAVPQIFCPYKEVLDLYNMDMQVPDDITLAWPDDNHGYIRRLSNPAEQARSGRAGVYYHISYWGSPHDYLWLCSTPLALIWEEMEKAYDYGADRVWIFNVGDIKPAEICMEFALRLAWNVDQYDRTNIQKYLEQWAWRQFGSEYKEQIANIMIEYYRLGLTRKPEHMSSGGAEFSLIHYGDEAQRRIDAYQTLVDEADAIYQSLPEIFKDTFYQTVLYPIRGASLMNQKILYAKKSIQYAAQERVSANDYAALSQNAYNQIIAETDFYNNSVATGKWKDMMSYNPRGLAVFNMPSTSTVSPISGSSMGVILEGQTAEITDANDPAVPFSDDFSDGTADGWLPVTESRWDVRANGVRMEYAINTTDYTNLSGDRLGEMSVIEDHVYENFDFTCLARSCDDFGSNSSADFAVVFGYVDELNYNYLIMSSNASNSGLYRVVGGTRSQVQMAGVGIPDNEFYVLELEKTTSGLTIRYNDEVLLTTTASFAGGLIGVGSYNDSAAFTEINITPLEGSSSVEMLPVFDVFTQNSHFIDIFNKGDTPFTWTATPSVSWIQLDSSSGSVDTQQRIWVSIEWDQIPLGDNNGTISITGAGSNLDVNLSAFNPVSPRPNEISGFVQSNGYASMEAEHYTHKTDRSGAGWEAIATLGRSGDTMAVFPTTTPSRDQIVDIVANSPMLEYQVYLWDTGQQKVTVHCIPTHAITSERGLRYAVAFDDQTPQIVEYDTVEWSSQWSINVLQGAAVSESSHTVSEIGQHTLKIWMVDPGVVIDKIIIGDAPASHLGPPETVIR